MCCVALALLAACVPGPCSTYQSFCGNGLLVVVPGATPALKAAVCGKWLHPITTQQYPNFASWMLYGERRRRGVRLWVGGWLCFLAGEGPVWLACTRVGVCRKGWHVHVGRAALRRPSLQAGTDADAGLQPTA